MSYFDARKVALSGILAGVSVICLFLASVMPTSKLSLYALSSFIVSIIMAEYGTRAGVVFYILTSILAFLAVPDKTRIVPYIVFFGVYGIIKFHVEKINRIILEYVIKILYFNICVAAWLMLFREIFLPEDAELKVSLWVVVLVLEAVFILYDYVYSLFIQYYLKRLKKFLKI
ncbi:MAG: hypothetical protein GX754_02085 [Clostridiaceae bacterium]|nr:hypothetical protein [Clostridiaceae bacterium]